MYYKTNSKYEKLAATGSRTKDTSGLRRQCSATEPWQPDDHQLSQIFYVWYWLPQLHTRQPVLGADGKFSSSRKNPCWIVFLL